MATVNKRAGQQMRAMRRSLGLTVIDVYHLTRQIAEMLRNHDYVVAFSRLTDIEAKGRTPNLYRLHSLSLVYNCKPEKLLEFYGITDNPKRGRPRSGRAVRRD